MTQIEALENAWSALKTHSESGNDDAGEAMPVIEKMLTTLIQRYDRRKIRRDGIRRHWLAATSQKPHKPLDTPADSGSENKE